MVAATIETPSIRVGIIHAMAMHPVRPLDPCGLPGHRIPTCTMAVAPTRVAIRTTSGEVAPFRLLPSPTRTARPAPHRLDRCSSPIQTSSTVAKPVTATTAVPPLRCKPILIPSNNHNDNNDNTEERDLRKPWW
mmetsp:Transcript_19423/g.39978  ORF Transcript_19423/g.39978 Transcript_19423/m.39978 type:complete len:134 (+) Transcript_19423:1695-2096(+)